MPRLIIERIRYIKITKTFGEKVSRVENSSKSYVHSYGTWSSSIFAQSKKNHLILNLYNSKNADSVLNLSNKLTLSALFESLKEKKQFGLLL